MSLKIRVKYDMQINDSAMDSIRESFPLGYDIGMYFAFLLQKKYGKKVTDYEIALLAVHFYSGLLEINNHAGNLKILVVTSLKKSMTLLLKQSLLHWFSEYVSTVDFKDPMDINEDILDQYDVFLTTEQDAFLESGLAMYIHPFPSQQDFLNIKLYIDGFKGIDDVIDIFHEDCFTVFNTAKKSDILETICANAEKTFQMEGLYEQVLKRENIGSTFFSKHIAIPHPLHSVSSDTFISVCVARKPVLWDEEKNEVHLIMLLHVGKNNTKAFQLWDYISKTFQDKDFIQSVLAKPDYDNFITSIKKSLEKGINNDGIL